jgi:hypothetical protein
MRSKRMTQEEKVAKQLGDIVSDLRIDLDLVGEYVARSQPNVVYNRLIEVAEATRFEKEGHVRKH